MSGGAKRCHALVPLAIDGWSFTWNIRFADDYNTRTEATVLLLSTSVSQRSCPILGL